MFKFNPITQKLDIAGPGGSGGDAVLTVTGDSGGHVSPDSFGNLNLIGSSVIAVAGNPGAHQLQINYSGPTVVTGTFTPTIAGSTGAGTPVYANQVGYYTTIGNMVFCQMLLEVTSLTGATGDIVLGGLPFNVSNSIGMDPLITLWNQNTSFQSPAQAWGMQLTHNTKTGTVTTGRNTPATWTPLSVNSLNGDDFFAGSFFYFM